MLRILPSDVLLQNLGPESRELVEWLQVRYGASYDEPIYALLQREMTDDPDGMCRQYALFALKTLADATS